MSRSDDDDSVMRREQAADDRDTDAVLRGRRPVDRPDLEPIAALVDDLRLSASLPAKPTAALAAVLTSGLSQPAATPAGSHRRTKQQSPAVRWMRVRSLRTTAKAGALAMIAALSVSSAAAAGALPDPIQEKVSSAVATVTPWKIPHPDGKGGVGKAVREKARHHGQTKNGNNGQGNDEPSTTGKPASPGNSDHAAKPSKSVPPAQLSHPVHPSKAAKSPSPVSPSWGGPASPSPRTSRRRPA